MAQQSHPNYQFLRRLRQFLELSRVDVQIGSSVRASRLAAAENGRAQLNEVEIAFLMDFYARRVQVVREREGVPPDVEDAIGTEHGFLELNGTCT
jgi:hypothetical protein